MKRRVFLSYSSADRKLAAGVTRELEKLGISAFIDSDLAPGAGWSATIMDELRKADSIVVFLTKPHAPVSSWAQYEIGAASALENTLFIAKPSSLSVRDLPIDVSSVQMIDFDPASPKKTARALAAL